MRIPTVVEQLRPPKKIKTRTANNEEDERERERTAYNKVLNMWTPCVSP